MPSERVEGVVGLLGIWSQVQLARLLGVTADEVFQLARRPPASGVPREVRARVEILVELVGELGRHLDVGLIAFWFYQPHPGLRGRAPVQAFVGEWGAADPAVRLVRHLAYSSGKVV